MGYLFISYPSLLREVLELTIDARDYVQSCDLQRLTTASRLRHAAESMRLTAVLSDAMNWLRGGAELAAGSIDREQQIRHFSARAGATLRAMRQDLPGELTDLADLLSRTRALYERIERLDRQIACLLPSHEQESVPAALR